MSDNLAFIAPLPAMGRAEEIAARLMEAINLGLIADGERLPPETDLAQRLGVAPMTLRDAISTLRDRGLVETRRGRSGGTFVRRFLEPNPAPDHDRLRSTPVGALRDLADAHAATSGMAARLAAERASTRDVQTIIGLVDQLRKAVGRGARMKADSRFHIEVTIATRSERLLRHEVALQAESAGMLWLQPIDSSDLEAAIAEHHDIATAIAEEDPDAARAAAERHVRSNLRRLTVRHLALAEQSDQKSEV